MNTFIPILLFIFFALNNVSNRCQAGLVNNQGGGGGKNLDRDELLEEASLSLNPVDYPYPYNMIYKRADGYANIEGKNVPYEYLRRYGRMMRPVIPLRYGKK
ncbi:unnamed protein product [Gordionus sp. m RMFG-2023]